MFELSSIATTSSPKIPIMLLYGVPGVNKTTFCAGAIDPIFLLTEDGLGSNQVAHFPEVATTYQDVIDAINALGESEHPYKTLVIDSASALEKIIIDQVCAEHNVNSIEAIGYGKGYVYAFEKWEELFSWLIQLRDHRDMQIILISHAEVVTFKNPEGDDYDRYQIDLDKRAMGLLREKCDIIAFMNYKVFVKKEDTKAIKGKAANKKTRVLHLNERPAFIAKNRYNLPDTLDIPDLSGDPDVAKKSYEVFGEYMAAYPTAIPAGWDSVEEDVSEAAEEESEEDQAA